MADIISQEVNIDMRERLPDGTYKIKYPKTVSEQIIGLQESFELSYGKSLSHGTVVFSGLGNDKVVNVGFEYSIMVIIEFDGTKVNVIYISGGVMCGSPGGFFTVSPTGFTGSNGSQVWNWFAYK